MDATSMAGPVLFAFEKVAMHRLLGRLLCFCMNVSCVGLQGYVSSWSSDWLTSCPIYSVDLGRVADEGGLNRHKKASRDRVVIVFRISCQCLLTLCTFVPDNVVKMHQSM